MPTDADAELELHNREMDVIIELIEEQDRLWGELRDEPIS